jgi:trimethylamine--corrinoid protein Co-methyltransferase
MRKGRKARQADDAPKRKTDYRNLKNPFPPMKAFSDDHIAKMHEAALDTLENLGVKVLLPAARETFRQGGAKVDESTEMVYIGRDIVQAALASAPKSIPVAGGARDRDIVLELGNLCFQPGAGAPHATVRIKGRRPGTWSDY